MPHSCSRFRVRGLSVSGVDESTGGAIRRVSLADHSSRGRLAQADGVDGWVARLLLLGPLSMDMRFELVRRARWGVAAFRRARA